MRQERVRQWLLWLEQLVVWEAVFLVVLSGPGRFCLILLHEAFQCLIECGLDMPLDQGWHLLSARLKITPQFL